MLRAHGVQTPSLKFTQQPQKLRLSVSSVPLQIPSKRRKAERGVSVCPVSFSKSVFSHILSSLNRRVPLERADLSLRPSVHQSPRTCLPPRKHLGNEEKWEPFFSYFLFFAFNLFLMKTQIDSLSGLFSCHHICPVCNLWHTWGLGGVGGGEKAAISFVIYTLFIHPLPSLHIFPVSGLPFSVDQPNIPL